MGQQKFIVTVTSPELLDETLIKSIRTHLKYFDAAAGDWRNPPKKSKRVDGKIEVTFTADDSAAISIHRNFTNDLNKGRADVQVTFISPRPISFAA